MIKNLFSEPIYQVENLISEEDNEKLIEECYRLKEITPNGAIAWDCDIYTTFAHGDPLTRNKVFDKLMKAHEEQINKFKEETVNSYDVRCDTAWFNIVSMGHYQEQHLHPGSKISAVYYMKSPKGSSGTKFKAPWDNQMGEMFGPNSPYCRMFMTEPTERSLLLFPSHLPHWVPLGKNIEDRITVASNWS